MEPPENQVKYLTLGHEKIQPAFCNFKKEAVIISIGSIFMTKVFGYVWLRHSYIIDHS
jgi:hypothetical protein